MKFSKRQIVEFKAKRRAFITWRKNLKPDQLKKSFYNNDKTSTLKTLFPNRNLSYCHCSMYDIVVGSYQLGLKYVNEKGTYYMFCAANSFWANPQDVAVGKVVDGKVYLVRESFPRSDYSMNFRVIPEECINREDKGFRPKSYNHSIFVPPSCVEQVVKDITDYDIKCLKIAYEGIQEFSKIIGEI